MKVRRKEIFEAIQFDGSNQNLAKLATWTNYRIVLHEASGTQDCYLDVFDEDGEDSEICKLQYWIVQSDEGVFDVWDVPEFESMFEAVSQTTPKKAKKANDPKKEPVLFYLWNNHPIALTLGIVFAIAISFGILLWSTP